MIPGNIFSNILGHEEELAQVKNSSKTKGNKPVPGDRKAAAAKTKPIPTPVRASCKAKATPKPPPPQSPEPSPLKSPNPQPLKRLKGKQPPNQDKIIGELQEAYQLVCFRQLYLGLPVCTVLLMLTPIYPPTLQHVPGRPIER